MSLSEDGCSTPGPVSRTSWLSHGVEILWIVLVMFVYAGGVSPDVNEPHYLGKTKHFWDSSFCEGDFFYGSRDAHAVFFWTFGWLTHWLSLPATAWVGRIIGWTLLATAWHGLSHALMPRRGVSLLTSALWIALVDRGQMSGEWILGGIEAKVVSYAFVFWSVRHMIANQWSRAWVCLGIATAFHVLVGGWAWFMAVFAIATLPSSARPPFRFYWIGATTGLGISMLALIPALMLSRGVPAEIVRQANLIYVFHRLSHHLLIRDFPIPFIVRHLLLVGVFLWLWRALCADTRMRCLFGFCGGGVALMVIGAFLDVTLGHTYFGMSWLRFYWFRASDVFTPAAVSLGFVYWVTQRGRSVAVYGRVAGAVIVIALLLNLGWVVIIERHHGIPAADRQSGITSATQLRAWQNVCGWVNQNLPHQTQFLTPGIQTFKWYAHRPEIVSWKDVPQDAENIVEWSDRVRAVRQWNASATAADSAARLEQLHAAYQFDFVITGWPRQFADPTWHPIYQNAHYAVLAPLPPSRANTTPAGEVGNELEETEAP